MPPPPPPLLDELIEEVLLRFPPGEPARLFHAALVCKRWCRLVSEPRFSRRFREFHRSPPMLGFLCNLSGFNLFDDDARFVPTTSFCSPQADRRHWRALDARHGRVLIRRRHGLFSEDQDALVVWDPITGEEQELPIAPRHSISWTAAVLCAHSGTCDHLDCHSGSFRIVFLGSNGNEAFIYIYSSKDDEWSEPISTQQPLCHVDSVPSLLIRNTLYFRLHAAHKILIYDLQTHDISFIRLPPAYSNCYCFTAALITTEVGGLGFATERDSKLYMWSREVTPEVDGGWVLSRTIDLETLLPKYPNYACLSLPHVAGFADGIGLIFLKGGNGVVFTIDLKTYKVKKVCEGHNIHCIVPYMSFYTPAALGAACTSEGTSTDASSA